MKPLFAFFFAGVIILSLISAFAFIGQKYQVSEKHLEIVFRDIGHQLLLHAKDSTSRVLPVKKLDDHTYQLSFQNDFVFVPDTLISIVYRQLEKYRLPREYMVSVKDCQRKETVFAYEISAATGNLQPCGGRVQQTGCYLIQIEFLRKKQDGFSPFWLLLIPLGLAGFYLKTKLGKKKKEEPIAETNDCMLLGRFQFDAARQLLHFENKAIKLSEKESKSLKIFAGNLNQVVEREQLMKDIWEDDGLVVISRNVDVLVSKLRKKLSDDSSIKIVNVHGRGYKLIVE
jgi:DNA-binding winged helix-turn-helix (wHTH) protein